MLHDMFLSIIFIIILVFLIFSIKKKKSFLIYGFIPNILLLVIPDFMHNIIIKKIFMSLLLLTGMVFINIYFIIDIREKKYKNKFKAILIISVLNIAAICLLYYNFIR